MPALRTMVASLLLSAAGKDHPPGLAIVGGTVLPMDGSGPLLDQTVLIEGDRIVAVGPRATTPVPTGSKLVDAHGRWVLPGLVDAHVHVFDEHDLPLFLAAGVTTVVNMSGSALTLEWRRAVKEGGLLGPRIVTTGPMIDQVDDPIFGLMREVGSEADAQRVVRETAAAGYDLVKLHGDIEVGLYDAVVEEARAHDLRVVGHLSERVGLLHAMKMRQTTVEHTEELLFGFFNGRFERKRIPVAMDALRRGGAAVTPTLVSIERIARMLTDDIAMLEAAPSDMPPLERVNWPRDRNPYRRADIGDAAWFAQSLAFQRELVGALDAAGVPLLAGTDSGWVPFLSHGQALHDELVELVTAGQTPYEALWSATRAPGDLYGGGQVVAGFPADLLVLDADPTVDIHAVGAIVGVVGQGHWYDRRALDGFVTDIQARNARQRPVADAVAQGDVDGALEPAGGSLRSEEPAPRAPGRLPPPRNQRRLDPLDESGYRTLAMALGQAGQPGAARRALEASARAHPRSWSALELAGRAALVEGRNEDARARLAEALTRSPGPAATAEITHELEKVGA